VEVLGISLAEVAFDALKELTSLSIPNILGKIRSDPKKRRKSRSQEEEESGRGVSSSSRRRRRRRGRRRRRLEIPMGLNLDLLAALIEPPPKFELLLGRIVDESRTNILGKGAL